MTLPSDHISHARVKVGIKVYTSIVPMEGNKSGALYRVAPPTVEVMKDVPSNSALIRDNPKSTRHALPLSSISTLPPFRSPWVIPCECTSYTLINAGRIAGNLDNTYSKRDLRQYHKASNNKFVYSTHEHMMYLQFEGGEGEASRLGRGCSDCRNSST